LFSFNNPAGACPSCDGLGMKQFFDEDKVINSDELSLSEGAIRGWDRRNVYYFQMLNSLSQSLGFDMDVALKELPKDIRKKVLHGTGKESIEFRYLNDRGDIIKRN
ncbi:MAG TPA: excinuclease ABC subunit UvrA, partial [Alcanivorax sp.]|nr:excinuclease ABC subunit UvrA [Alcanivorax sp.]